MRVPSGIDTPLSTMARSITQCLPTSTPSNSMEFVTDAKLLTRTRGEKMQRSTFPPEIIDPEQIKLSVAYPILGSLDSLSLNTNFGGGNGGCHVRIGQS